ncbi:hypothetical protein LOK49_LG14G01370 [Camellia lanceoleosa]|uniref:Uncharacterized protein n=1 Tax=Camellia lanceoleosa TaxID=1840588 RepID=A0ACC0FDT9_9ERIC|nr:hypothetical protein LOK49_LG14G01370 [Camellia lanceoleosa]
MARPLIDNPNYKRYLEATGNSKPDYFELDKPDFEPIAAIGIEIWTMQDGILFDNILIAGDEKVAESIRLTAWKPKFEVEKEKQKSEEASAGLSEGLKGFQKTVFDVLYKIADIPFLSGHKVKILDVIEKAEQQPNITIGVIVSIVIVIVTVLFKILFGGKKPAKVSAAGTSTSSTGRLRLPTRKEAVKKRRRRRRSRMTRKMLMLLLEKEYQA